tara:strand:+ start:202 stop:324 length:123 start_codon:yes stop_codon:yes gene_type:complete
MKEKRIHYFMSDMRIQSLIGKLAKAIDFDLIIPAKLRGIV